MVRLSICVVLQHLIAIGVRRDCYWIAMRFLLDCDAIAVGLRCDCYWIAPDRSPRREQPPLREMVVTIILDGIILDYYWIAVGLLLVDALGARATSPTRDGEWCGIVT